MNTENNVNKLYKGFLILVCLFCVFLYFYPDNLSLWHDELYSVTNTYHWGSYKRLFWGTMVKDGNPPLYQTFLYAWAQLFGISDYILRLPSAIFAMTTIIFAIAYGRKIIGLNQSLLLATFLAVSWGTVSNAHEARAYSLLMLFSTILMLQSQKIVLYQKNTKTTIRLLIFIFMTGVLLCYTHYFGALLYFSNMAGMLCFITKSRKKIIITATLTFLTFIPWLCLFLNNHNLSQPFWIVKESLWEYTKLLFVLAFYRTYLSIILFAVLAFMLIILPMKTRLSIFKKISFPLLVIITTIVGALAINELKPLIIMRYMIVILPYIYIIVSLILFESLNSNLDSNQKTSYLNFFFIFIIVSSFCYQLIKKYVAMEKEDWRGAAKFILQSKNIEKIYCVNGKRFYWYYLRDSDIDSNKLIGVKIKNSEKIVRPSHSNNISVLWGVHDMNIYQALKDSISARGFEIIEERVFDVKPETPSGSNLSKCILFK